MAEPAAGGLPSPRQAAAQVVVDDLERPQPRDDQRHHLTRVLRLRPGELVVASDGRGNWRICRFDGRGELDPVGPIGHVEARENPVTVGFALVKGGKAELVVQKLTELGVDRIVPFHAERSVVRWDADRAHKHLERLRRVAEESCAQCRRMRFPTIGWHADPAGDDGPTGGDVVADTSVLRAAGAALADGGGRALAGSDTMLLIGPEGGWSEAELDGADRVELAPLVLRADTAAITAGVLLCAART